MKRWYLIAALLVIVMAVCGGCTQNGGHIGDLFGRWHLERIEAEGREAPVMRGEIFWAFQGDMFQMQLAWSQHSVSTTFGVYSLRDDVLVLNFPEENKAPFVDTGLGRENTLEVLKLTGKEMVLVNRPAPEETLTYYLRKW